jgi:ribosome modulation factor
MTERRDAYPEGRKAGLEGKELWENPHSGLYSHPNDFHAWFAGWCDGRKRREELTQNTNQAHRADP